MKDEKPQPGAPPTPEQPKPTSERAVSFSYEDLMFTDFFVSENRKFVRFLVTIDKPFYLDLFFSEFCEYQAFVWESINRIRESKQEDQCVCNKCTPHLEFLEDIEVTLTLSNEETTEEVEQKKLFPLYFSPSLVDETVVGGLCKIK